MTSPQVIHPLDGLSIEPRKIITDERGSLLHMLKSSNSKQPVAEIYFSSVLPGVNKGWKRHKRMWQRFSVPIGEIEFKFFDERPHSVTFGQSFSIRVSRNYHVLVTVPPGIWYSFRCTSLTEALIVNASDIEHDPTETETRPLA
jgi:dTDP-4-dehydrorhamnose 3,5-epimerase